MKIKILFLSFCLGIVQLAAAATRYTTIESTVDLGNATGPVSERVVKITGPDKNVYVVEAEPKTVERITELVQSKPKTIISFNGDIVEENGRRMFRVKDWQTVSTTTTTTTTDELGNKSVESNTETHTEPVR